MSQFKKYIWMLLLPLSSTCIASEIVYVDQSKIQASSTVLNYYEQSINSKYNKKIQTLEQEQAKLNQDLNTNKSDKTLISKSLKLQQSLAEITLEKDKKAKEIQTNFFTTEKKVLNKLRQDKNYAYIINADALFAAESANDISASVVKLTDAEYNKTYK